MIRLSHSENIFEIAYIENLVVLFSLKTVCCDSDMARKMFLHFTNEMSYDRKN